MAKFKHNNGDEVKAVTNGFNGVITASAEHLFGCNRYYVQPPCENNVVKDGCWFDEDELQTIVEQKIKGSTHNNGGFPSAIK